MTNGVTHSHVNCKLRMKEATSRNIKHKGESREFRRATLTVLLNIIISSKKVKNKIKTFCMLPNVHRSPKTKDSIFTCMDNDLSSGCCLSCKPFLRLFDDRQLDTLTLGKRYPRLRSLPNGEHIAQPSCKFMSSGILNVDRLEASLVLLPVLDDSDPAPVPSTSHHDYIPNIKFDEFGDLVVL